MLSHSSLPTYQQNSLLPSSGYNSNSSLFYPEDEATGVAEMPVMIYQTVWYHIPEDFIVTSQNHKSQKEICFSEACPGSCLLLDQPPC
jgi:hypothetical protein